MPTVADYLARVPPEHAGDANFMAELQGILQPFVDAQTFLASLPAAFDVDLAIGVQLDATGAWVGISREIPVPVENPWFSFDIAGLGWDQGYWFGPFDGVALAALDDETYRRLIRAVIIANGSQGTQADILASLAEYFSTSSATLIFVYDATDYVLEPGGPGSVNLRMVVGIAGALPNIVDLSILQQMLIPFAGGGVAVDWAVTTVDDTPVFGFDVENEFISGWDEGSWGASPGYVAANIPV